MLVVGDLVVDTWVGCVTKAVLVGGDGRCLVFFFKLVRLEFRFPLGRGVAVFCSRSSLGGCTWSSICQ